MIIWLFKKYCNNNATYGTGDSANFEEDGNYNYDELDIVYIHSDVTIK